MQEALEGFASLEIPPLNGEKEGEREREGGGEKAAASISLRSRLRTPRVEYLPSLHRPSRTL